MATEIQTVIDKRARLWEESKQLPINAAKEGRAMTQEEADKFEKIDADIRALDKTIEAFNAVEKREKEQAAQHFEQREAEGKIWTSTSTADKGQERAYEQTYIQYLRSGIQALNPEQRQILQNVRGTNTQVVGTDSLGGYGVPDEWQPGIIEVMKDYSGILQVADVMYTSNGRKHYFLIEDDTTTEAVQVAESAAFTIQDITQSQKELDTYKYGTLVKESYELMFDDAYNLAGTMQKRLGARFGRRLNTDCTTGDGSGKPNGVVTATSAGKTAASATAITYLEILDLKHSIDPAYRNSKKFGFMFNDAVLLYLKKLVDSEGRPLWQPSYVAGHPSTIDGSPYWINQGMDSSINASSKLILCGDFDYYKIRISKEMEMRRLDELYAVNGQVGFMAWMRFDADLMDASAIKHLITAAS